VRARLRSLHKRTRAGGKPNAPEVYALISAIDKAAKSGVIHRNAADRRKARLNKLLAAAK
jgi:ribosomal protein S20